jgi:hypothetical protein
LESFGRVIIAVKSIKTLMVYSTDIQTASLLLGPWNVSEMDLTVTRWTDAIDSALAAHVTGNKSLRKLSIAVEETEPGHLILSVNLLKAF